MAEDKSDVLGGGLDADTRQWLYRMLLGLPGFLSLGLARYLGDLGAFGDFELTTYSLALSLLIFLVAALLYGLLRKISPRHRHERLRLLPTLSLGFAMTVLALSLFLGASLADFSHSDTGLSIARHVPGLGWLSKRSSARPFSFILTLNGHGELDKIPGIPTRDRMAWVEVTVEGGNRFAGFPRFYSKESESSEIFLMPACSFQGAQLVPVTGPGVLIREDKIISMLFLDRAKSACQNLWYPPDSGKQSVGEVAHKKAF